MNSYLIYLMLLCIIHKTTFSYELVVFNLYLFTFYPKYIPKNCATDASIMNMCHIEWKYLRFFA